ncbi:MAG: hypothetical protein WB562_02630 [Candidatus Sulfotelmatobacter sp.]
MHRKAAIILFSIAAVTIVLAWFSKGPLEKLHKNPSSHVDFTGVPLPVPENVVVHRISVISKGEPGLNRHLVLPGKFERFQLANFQDPAFPPEFSLRMNSKDNPALQRYAETGDSSKQNDFYLFAPVDVYWTSSEYTYRNKPARFTCNFIIHLQPLGNAGTWVEVIEYLPRALVGKKLGWSAHTGPLPQLFDDIQAVPPTVEDRTDMLNDLKAVLVPRD